MGNVGLGGGKHLLLSSDYSGSTEIFEVIQKQSRSLFMIIIALLLLLFSCCHSHHILEQWLSLVVWRGRVSTAGAVSRASNTAGRDLLTQLEFGMFVVDHIPVV